MKITVIASILFVSPVLMSASVHAQEMGSDESMIEISKTESAAPEVTLQLTEATEEIDPEKVQQIANESGETIAYVIEKESGEKLVLGVARTRDLSDGIINAYVGVQTIVGVRAGIEILKNIQIGVHASTTGSGLIVDKINKKGVHVNVSFLNINTDARDSLYKSLSFYVGAKYNNFQKTHRDVGYYTTVLKGNTAEGLLGVNAFIDERQSVGIEVGYSQTVGKGMTNYAGANRVVGENIRFNAPFVTLTYTVRLFKR